MNVNYELRADLYLLISIVVYFVLHTLDIVKLGEEGNERIEPNLSAIRSCIRMLPPGNRCVLQHVLTLLVNIANLHEVNQMTASNLATCFSPILVRYVPTRNQIL